MRALILILIGWVALNVAAEVVPVPEPKEPSKELPADIPPKGPAPKVPKKKAKKAPLPVPETKPARPDGEALKPPVPPIEPQAPPKPPEEN